jgi:hypothetical protein
MSVALARVGDGGRDPGVRAALGILLVAIAAVGEQRVDRASNLGQRLEALQGRGNLLLVVGVIGDVLSNDQVRLGIGAGLGVVGSRAAAAGGGHDARCGIAEADLFLGLRARLGRLGGMPRAKSPRPPGGVPISGRGAAVSPPSPLGWGLAAPKAAIRVSSSVLRTATR